MSKAIFVGVGGVCGWILAAALAGAAEPQGVLGAWDITLETQDGPRPSWVKLFEENNAPVAEFVGITGGKSRAADVKIDGDKVRWTLGRATYEATLGDGKLSGHHVEGNRRIPFTAERVVRRTNVAGSWDVQIDVGDNTIERVITLEQDGDRITGSTQGGALPDAKLDSITLAGNKLKFAITVARDEGDFIVDYELDVRGDQLAGTVAVRGTDFQGEVKGTRRRQWGEPIQLVREDLSNWEFQRVGDANNWKIVDGVLANSASGWNIQTRDKFKDYKLRVDVKIPEGGNSGIYLNGRYEVQVADSHGRGVSEGGMGAIYGRAVPTANPAKPAGEWQTFEITFVDYYATVKLNGETIIDNVLIEGITGGALDSHESEPGPIMLQGDHGPIEYRNIVLTPVAE